MISDLGEDLIEEILSRVPVTSLRGLKSTCKRWYHEALFRDRRFIKKHTEQTAREYDAIMVIDGRVCSLRSVLERSPFIHSMASCGIGLTVPHSDELVDVCGAFRYDGILLCTHKVNMLVVWEPFSGKTRWIQPQEHYDGAYALGYDNNQLCRSYKILRFRCTYDRVLKPWRKLDRTPEGALKYEIYEFSSNSWRSLDAIPPDAYLNHSSGVSLKGNTYWVDKRFFVCNINDSSPEDQCCALKL